MKVYGKNLRISPKKLRVVAEVIKNKDAVWALHFLKYAPKKGARILYKLLHSAISNAIHNDQQSIENLRIEKVIVTKGIVYKRGMPISRGRMHPILKRTSHVRLELNVK